MPLDHCVHLNAALALLVSKRCTHFKEALLLVQESVSSGKAFERASKNQLVISFYKDLNLRQ